HPDAEVIFRGVRNRLPTISLDTVYRTLWWLTDMGLISLLGPSRDRARFDSNLSPHHHFVCSRCGLTRDFFSSELDNLNLPSTLQSIGIAEKVQVEAIGLCTSCASNNISRLNKSTQEIKQ